MIGASSSLIISYHNNVARRDGAVKFSPAKESHVDGVVGRDRRANGWTILSRGLSRFDRKGFISRGVIDGYIYRCRVVVGMFEVFKLLLHLVGVVICILCIKGLVFSGTVCLETD